MDLGKTGAGLKPEDITPESEIANEHGKILAWRFASTLTVIPRSIERIREEFPFWDDLHQLWRELPNYNPHSVITSVEDSGIDRQEQFQALVTNPSGTSSVAPERRQSTPQFMFSDPPGLNDDDDVHNPVRGTLVLKMLSLLILIVLRIPLFHLLLAKYRATQHQNPIPKLPYSMPLLLWRWHRGQMPPYPLLLAAL